MSRLIIILRITIGKLMKKSQSNNL